MAPTVCRPCSSSTSATMTLAPACAIKRAVSPPMPRAAPEISATLPSRQFIFLSPLPGRFGCCRAQPCRQPMQARPLRQTTTRCRPSRLMAETGQASALAISRPWKSQRRVLFRRAAPKQMGGEPKASATGSARCRQSDTREAGRTRRPDLHHPRHPRASTSPAEEVKGSSASPSSAMLNGFITGRMPRSVHDWRAAASA